MKTEIKEDSQYLVGTNLREGGMLIIETGKIKDDIITIYLFSKKNGELIDFGDKNILELQKIFNRDGYQKI